jgi:hypothetical protein
MGRHWCDNIIPAGLYGANHLEAAYFVQIFLPFKKSQNFNPSWENTPFEGRNKILRWIFHWVKTERAKYFGQVQFGAWVLLLLNT